MRDDGDWEGWLAFFLDGVAQVASEATETAIRITELRERDRTRITGALGRRATTALSLLDMLFGQPVVTGRRVESLLGVSQPTASALVRKMAEIGVLREISGRRRNRVYSYPQYLGLFSGVTERS